MQSMGVDLVWFCVLVAIVLQSSFLTPPVGFTLFYLKGVAPPEVTTRDVYRGIVPFVGLILVCVVIVYVWKDLVLWLPSVAY
jgi:TRAP-type mannitol/chloroaromatic compound transport system permease large subunit